MICPADQKMTAFLDGELAANEAATFEAHVAGCEDCATVVGHLGALLEPGPTVIGDRYQVESLLGRGGMGEVWAAYDPELERRVAIKLIREHIGEIASKRLVREARALARLQHAHVVAVYDVGESDDEVFIVTELVDGETLSTWQVDRPRDAVVGAYLDAAAGLAAAHRQGLVHRDIKPTNLFIGSSGQVKVGDFGLAIAAGSPNVPAAGSPDLAVDSRATATGALAGTPAYMAPEQRKGSQADARSDQFSLTVSLVEAIAGRRPAAGTSADELAGCGPLAPVLARALSPEPSDRFADMDAWSGALRSAAEMRAPARKSRTWMIAIVPSVLAIAAIVIALEPWGSDASAPEPQPAAEISEPAAGAGASAAATVPAVAAPQAATADANPAPAVVASSKPATNRKTPAPSRPSITKQDPPSPPTAPTQTAPPQTAPPGAASPDGIKRADRALYRGDTSACFAALDSVGPVTGREQEQATVIRARCEMLSGQCDKGSTRMREVTGSDVAVSAAADAFCPTDAGPIATRVRRLNRQVNLFAMQRRFGCGKYAAPALSAAGDPGLGEVPRGKPTVKAVIEHLAACYAKAGKCERARTLVTDPRARKLSVRAEISGCSP